jgi:hypothetical protein
MIMIFGVKKLIHNKSKTKKVTKIMSLQTFWAIANIDPTDIEYIEYRIDIDVPDEDYDSTALQILEDMGYGSITAFGFTSRGEARQGFIQFCTPMSIYTQDNTRSTKLY